MVRSWDAESYHAVSGPMVDMARDVLDRLPLRGDETVLDAGCGTGLVTRLLLDRLTSGRVIAVDADPAMVAKAREHLGDRAEVSRANLLELDLEEPVDAVFSTATFHWIPDHDALFARLFAALKPGGRLVAQCGGEGNLHRILAATDAVAERPGWRDRFAGWTRPTRFASPDAMEAALLRAGFEDVSCRLVERPVIPQDPDRYLATITCGAHLDRLPPEDRPRFVSEVVEEAGSPVEVDYVRLDIDAVRPA